MVQKKTIKLDSGEYSKEELETMLNNKVSNLNIKVKIEGSHLILQHNKSGEGNIKLDPNSSAYITLFCKTSYSRPCSYSGKTKIIPPKEGSTDYDIEYEPAKAESRKYFESNEIVKIDDSNDELKFIVSGKEISIKLTHGDYSPNSLKNELQSKINKQTDNVIAKIESNRLVFETKQKGEGQSFSNFGGSGYEDILCKKNIHKPYNDNSQGEKIKYSITARSKIDDDIEIDDSNNNLRFTYYDGQKNKDVNINIDNGKYSAEDLVKKINEQIGEIPISVINNNGHIKLECNEVGNEYKLDDFSGGFYENIFRETITKKNSIDPECILGHSNSEARQQCYVVGRKDISKGVVINPNINDELSFKYNHNGKTENIFMKLSPGNYSSGELIDEINSKLDEKNVDYVRAQYGGVDTGTTADDSNKLVFKNTKEDNGSYVIDGVSGSSAYSIFYNASSEPTPTHTVGVVDLSKGIIINENNDTFIFDENGETKELKFATKSYSPEEFLEEINNKLKGANSNFIASYYEGRLKFSYDAVGYNTIDNIRGSASEDIFFNSEKRSVEKLERTFQIGANSGESITIDPIRASTGLLGISTLTVENRKSGEKALERIDRAINIVSENRGKAGAHENRIEHSIRNSDNYAENLQASESRITDLDMAKEIMEKVKQDMLLEVSNAVLAQSNIDAQRAMKLLMDV